MSTYTKPTISNYNDNPPSNDGSTNFVDNGVDWDLHINEIGDPLKNFEESEATATESAFSDLQDMSAINVQDPDYGATGDGTTDDSTAIQLAISVAEAVPGTTITFPPGAYNLGTTGLTILGDGIILEGLSPRFVGSALFGVEFLYSGAATVVTFGSSAKAAHYRNGFKNIQIRATGSATSSATAIGLKLINQHYFRSDESAVKDFESGIGLQFKPLDIGVGFGALNAFYGFITHLCKIGIQTTSLSVFTKENAATFYGGTVIGDNSSGSIGCDLDEFADSFTFYSTDFESFEICVKCAGRGTRFIATRTEFQTTWGIQLTATSLRNSIISHQWSGSASESDTLQNLGNANYRIDERGCWDLPVVRPSTDGGEVFQVMDEAGDTVFDISTTSPTAPTVELVNNTSLLVWSDAFSTLTAKITASTGNVLGQTFTAEGTPVAVSAGSIQIGGDVSPAASAGSATLPANPLGFIVAYVGTTQVKIPYYSI